MKKWIFWAALAASCAAAAAVYFQPHPLVSVPAAEVSQVFLAGDRQATIEDRQQIERIVGHLNGVIVRRSRPSGTGGRMQCMVRLYGKRGEALCTLWIGDENTVDDGTFFCKTREGQLDLGYLRLLTA